MSSNLDVLLAMWNQIKSIEAKIDQLLLAQKKSEKPPMGISETQ